MFMALLLVFGTTASAFDDLPAGADRDKIMSLKEQGIVSGYGSLFRGEQRLTNAEGIHLIVKSTGLSLAAFQFFKAPLASDSFDNVDNDAWYADSFIIAAVNGVGVPRDIKPNEEMTREAYAHYLHHALMLTGEYAFTEMYFQLSDAGEVTAEYMNSLQVLMNGKIIAPPDDGNFRPKEPVTRREAAVWAYNAAEFIASHAESPSGEEEPTGTDVEQSVTAVNDDINKVTLSWGEKPHSGYSLTIESVVFKSDMTAEIHYKLHLPEEGMMYPQVITTPAASVYLASAYTPVAVLDR
jgi:hypothetical protein